MNTLSIHEIETRHPDFVCVWAWHNRRWYHYHHIEKFLMRRTTSDLSTQIVVLGKNAHIIARYFDTVLLEAQLADGSESIQNLEPPVGLYQSE